MKEIFFLLGLRPIPPLYLIKVLSFSFLAVMQGVAIVMPYGAHGRGSFERVRRIRIRILWGRRVIPLFMPVRRCLRDRGVSGRKRRVLYGWISS
jgi:hypothetical protein